VPDEYGLFGYPVQHSWSPFIHGMFARQCDQDMVYDCTSRRRPLPQRRAGLLQRRRARHQRHPAAQARRRGPRQRAHAARAAADAVNTIVRRDERLVGDNTDGAGLLADLTRNLGLGWESPRILVLGAGGAARGALAPLLSLRPRLLMIANRSPERAAQLASEFAELGPVTGCEFGKLENQRFDLIVNATSASLRARCRSSRSAWSTR